MNTSTPQAGVHGSPMRFTCILTNPPYQESNGSGSYGVGARPLYHRFIQHAISLAPRYALMIVPSRWFSGGLGLNAFRAQMLAERRISHMVDFLDSEKVFPGVRIGGGVNYFLWDREYDGDCRVTTRGRGADYEQMRALGGYDIFIRHGRALSIVEKVQAAGEPPLVVSVSAPFDLATNFADYSDTRFRGSVQLWARGNVGWVDRKLVTKNRDWIGQYKILIPLMGVAVDAFPHQVIGRPFLIGRDSCCTQTYLVLGAYDTIVEARNFERYTKTKFFRFLVMLRRPGILSSRSTFAFVLTLDMTVRWTDEMLYDAYGLTADEVAFIETSVTALT